MSESVYRLGTESTTEGNTQRHLTVKIEILKILTEQRIMHILKLSMIGINLTKKYKKQQLEQKKRKI